MPYGSPLQYFRDIYKNPDQHPENKETVEVIENEKYSEKNSKNNEKERLTGVGETYRKTINTIRDSSLKDEFKNDEEEKKILESRKELALRFLSRVMMDVRNYVSQINFLKLQMAASYDSADKYQEAVGKSDALRRSYHNTLINDIKITMRLINNNFNIDFPEQVRLKEEANVADRKNLSLEQIKNKMNERTYSSFDYPVGVFIDFSRAPKDPQGEREYIAYWALNLYNDLSALEKEFNK